MGNAMFTVCRNSHELSDKEVIDHLALLTGMACAALMDYADRLEDEGQ